MDPNQQPSPIAPETPVTPQPATQPVPTSVAPEVVASQPMAPPTYTPMAASTPTPEQTQTSAQPVAIPTPATAPKIGKWRASKSLVRSSWRVLMLDKELMWLPILSGLAALVITIAIVIMVVASSSVVPDATGGTTYSGPLSSSNPFAIVFYGAVYLLTTFIANYFAAALIAGAIERFNGGNPTVRSALAAAKAHIGALFLFSLLASTIGYILQMIEERVPLAGKFVTWLVGAAWSIASMFSVAVIVTSAEHVGPVDATKQSVDIIKRTWGENVIVSIGIGIAAGLAMLAYIALSVVLWVIIGSAGVSGYVAIPLAILTVAGFIMVAFVISMLGAIVKAAIFYYASTGRAPQEFEAQLLQASFTPKKARRIFGA